MPQGRPNIPTALKRRILVEAGHRCAIPTCRAPHVEFAHIIPWSKVKKHEYANLIALCSNCHDLFDRGEIDAKSMRQYKAQLRFLTDRYTMFELDVMDALFEVSEEDQGIAFPGYMLLLVKRLLDEELVTFSEVDGGYGIKVGHIQLAPGVLFFTPQGKQFVQDFRAGKDLSYEQVK